LFLSVRLLFLLLAFQQDQFYQKQKPYPSSIAFLSLDVFRGFFRVGRFYLLLAFQ
jgi:hypothetical protein